MVDTVNTDAARRVEWQNKIKHSYNLQIIVIEPGRPQAVLVSYKHWFSCSIREKTYYNLY